MNPESNLIDGRDMEPPEPLELAIAKLAAMQPGEELVMLLRCEPIPLYAMLDRNGYPHRSARLADGTTEVRIQKN